MSIQVSWLVEGQLVYWKSIGVDTDDEYAEAQEEALRLYDASNASLVHMILDFSELERSATIDFNKEQKIPLHPKNGWNIFVALENPLLKMLTAVKGGQAKARMRWFSTIEEALEFLPTVVSSLPDSAEMIDNLKNTSV